jgi:hypothetical protein
VPPALFYAALAVLVFVPSLPPFCPMRRTLHVPCPACGLTRAVRLAMEGDFAAATAMHPLWFVVAPLVAIVFVADTIHYVRTGRVASVLGGGWGMRIGVAVALLLVAVWVARFFGACGGPSPV